MGMSALRHLEAAAIAILAVFAPIGPVLATVVVLVLADLGMALAVALKGRQPVTSRGVRRTVIKLLAYEVVLAACFLAEAHLGLPIPAVKLLAGLIAAAELKSLLEHADELTGVGVFKAILNKLAPEKKE
jgi:hypothetical protein